MTAIVSVSAAMLIAGACADKDDDKKAAPGYDAAFNIESLLDTGVSEQQKGVSRYDGGLYVDPGGRDGILVTQAVVTMKALNGSRVEGTVRLLETRTGVKAALDLKGLTYLSKYTVRVHLLGNCSGDDGVAAGPGFSFDESSLDPSNAASAGLFGEIEGDLGGNAKGEAAIEGPAIRGPWTIVGRALMIHEAADGLSQDPTGKRIGCGVIGVNADIVQPMAGGDR